MLLRSQIAETLLAEGCRLVVCSPNADEPYFRDEFASSQIDLEVMPTKMSRWESRLSTWRQYLLMNPVLGGTLNYKRETLRRERPNRYRITRALNLLLGNIPILRKAYMALEQRFFPGKEFDALFRRHRPDLVVTGTPGFNNHDVHALRAAKRAGIPTATVMLSWDNLTSKGYMNGTPDHLLVWSDLMRDEALEYHDYPQQKIHQVGAAQFDIYHEAESRFDRQAWRDDRNIPQDAFLLVYGTINPGICPHDIEIVREIVRVMQSGQIQRPAFLWIRLHPQMVKGPWKQVLASFFDLQSDNVYVEVPPVQSDALNWDLPKSDATHLMQLLAAADLVVTTSSTLSIDAACAGTPIVNVFFDGAQAVESAISVSRFQQYTHYAKILKTGGIGVACDVGQFVDLANRYRADPACGSKDREAMIRQQIGQLDGKSGQRTAAALLKCAGRNRG